MNSRGRDSDSRIRARNKQRQAMGPIDRWTPGSVDRPPWLTHLRKLTDQELLRLTKLARLNAAMIDAAIPDVLQKLETTGFHLNAAQQAKLETLVGPLIHEEMRHPEHARGNGCLYGTHGSTMDDELHLKMLGLYVQGVKPGRMHVRLGLTRLVAGKKQRGMALQTFHEQIRNPMRYAVRRQFRKRHTKQLDALLREPLWLYFEPRRAPRKVRGTS